MKYRSNIRKYSEYVFENLDPDFARRAAAHRDAGRHNVIVGGWSYGQGSSREHASICPGFLGVRVVLAKSFERIHAANLINFGIIPLTFADQADYDRLAQGNAVVIPNLRNQIQSGGILMLSNRYTGIQFEVKADLTERQRAIVVSGGALSIHQ
jgi:aconitate hydratase